MTEYIEREAAIESFCDGCIDEKDCHASPHKYVCAEVETIKAIPAANVRPVVLCKDCKYYYKDADGYEMCDNSEGYDHVTEDGFCAWAKKREES